MQTSGANGEYAFGLAPGAEKPTYPHSMWFQEETGQPWTTLSPLPHRSPLLSCYRQHLVAIFFDIEKAYDTTWRYGILRTIHSWGLRGRLPLFLVAFLSSRYFRVRLGDRLSASHHLENGCPSGLQILSVTLFAIAINSIASIIREPVKASLFVDDLPFSALPRVFK